MLLRDEKTAAEIRQAVANVRDATSSLKHASGQADALVSDFQSRNFGEKLDQTMENVHRAAHTVDATTQQLLWLSRWKRVCR
jgi:hypothetical protein